MSTQIYALRSKTEAWYWSARHRTRSRMNGWIAGRVTTAMLSDRYPDEHSAAVPTEDTGDVVEVSAYRDGLGGHVAIDVPTGLAVLSPGRALELAGELARMVRTLDGAER